MKENNNTNPAVTTEKKKMSWWTWALLVAVIGVGGYFGYQKMGDFSFNGIFTEYPPIVLDTLVVANLQDSVLDNMELLDSTSTMITDSTATVFPEDSVETEVAKIGIPQVSGTATVDLFKVNTTYGKIDSATAISADKVKIESAETSTLQIMGTDLFEELLMPENVDEDFEKAFLQYSQSPIVTSKSVLKLLSIVGKQIILGKNTNDVHDIIQTLTESESIENILIVDRKGRVVYATNQKQINVAIQSIMPKVDMESSTLSWYQGSGKTVAAIPLFHVYGKIGKAVLVTGR